MDKLISMNKSRKIVFLEASLIKPTPYQPRKVFEEKSLYELSQSIKRFGIISPLLVRHMGDEYILVAGERRLRAATLAGLKTVPCIISDKDTLSCAQLSLIENIQRENLGVFEEAIAYKSLIDNFSLTQTDLAKKLGKTQASIANKLRILKLPPTAQAIIAENGLSERHARALLKIKDSAKLYSVLDMVTSKKLTVEQTERVIEKLASDKKPGKKFQGIAKDMRLFQNTINKAVQLIKKAGIQPSTYKKEGEGYIEYIIRIPKTS